MLICRHELPRCPHCGSSFKALARHIQAFHRKRNTIDCPENGCHRKGRKGFGRQDNLRDHLRRVHDIPIPKSRRRKMKEVKWSVIEMYVVVGGNWLVRRVGRLYWRALYQVVDVGAGKLIDCIRKLCHIYVIGGRCWWKGGGGRIDWNSF